MNYIREYKGCLPNGSEVGDTERLSKLAGRVAIRFFCSQRRVAIRFSVYHSFVEPSFPTFLTPQPSLSDPLSSNGLHLGLPTIKEFGFSDPFSLWPLLRLLMRGLISAIVYKSPLRRPLG